MADMIDVTSWIAYKSKIWYSGKVPTTTFKFDIRTFRKFLKFCKNLNGVLDGIGNKVSIPQVDSEARSFKIEVEDAGAILSYFKRYKSASFRHVLIQLLWQTGMRTSLGRAMDLNDFCVDEQVYRNWT